MAHRHRRKFPQVRVELCNCPVSPPVLKLGMPGTPGTAGNAGSVLVGEVVEEEEGAGKDMLVQCLELRLDVMIRVQAVDPH